MALQIRRGTAAERTDITPAAGELLYTTDTKLVYVGDGTTAGGNIISGGGGGGITDIVNDTTPQLGGNLDSNGFQIVSTNNANLPILANGTGSIILGSSVTVGSNALGVDGSLTIVSNTFQTSGFTFAQHHSSVDASNFQFLRTRGTGSSQTAISNGDDILDMTFLGHDGTSAFTAAAMTVSVDGTVTTGRVPGRIRFFLHDGVTTGSGGVRTRLELVKDGTVKLDKLSSLSSTSITLPTNNYLQIGDVRLSQSGLSTSNSNADLFITANSNGRVYIDGSGWPASLGTSGQFLSTDGSGSLSWSNAPGSAVRTAVSESTTSVADGGTVPILIPGFKTYSLLKIESSHAAWIRLYVSDAARTADATRTEGVDPAPGAGVLAEVVTTGSQTILMSPGVFGWSNENPANTNIPCAVTNKSGSTAVITVTLTLIQLEV
jgi:hypothetical protein